MDKQKALFHIVWGGILSAFGVAVFFRVTEVMPQIEQIGQFSTLTGFIRFCFYLIGALLIFGGIKKIIENYRQLRKS